MINIVLSFSTSLLICLFLTPLMIAFANKWKILDMPNYRKSHATPTPLLGGLAILVSTIISIVLFAITTNNLVIPILIIGISGVSIIGLIDDIISLSACRRLIVLFILALVVYFGIVQFYFIEHLHTLTLKILFGLFVLIWIVGITNAINFSDGIDGLSSYLSLVAAIAFAVIFSIQGRNLFALPIALALAGAIAGFIPYNRNPAMIFMGDAGSMFLGFMLGLLSITVIAKEDNFLSIIVPVYIMLVPIADMCMSILRRLILRKPIMKPDKKHFHHVLNNRFNNHLIVVVILTLVQIVFAALGVLIFVYKLYLGGAILLIGLALIAIIITVINANHIKKTEHHTTSVAE